MKRLISKIEELVNSSQYEEVCNVVKEEFGISLDVKFKVNGKHFASDKENRDIYTITLSRGKRSYTFEFGQSINNSGFYYTVGVRKTPLDRKYLAKDYFKGKQLGLIGTIRMQDSSFSPQCKSDTIHYPKEPTMYDILTCLQKYDIGTFKDFCSEFGCDENSRTAEKTYKAVEKEFKAMQSLFSDEELEVLSYIN
jgi:hypothetical protein